MAAVEENKADESKLEELPEKEKALLDKLTKGPFTKEGGWTEKTTWEEKELNVKGQIFSTKLGDDPCLWCRSVTEFSGDISKKEVSDEYWANIDVYAKNKADVGESEATARGPNKEATEVYMTFPMPLMISNRDLHCEIKSYKYGDGTVTVWRAIEKKEKPVPKKWVRMTLTSFGFSEYNDGCYKTTDFDRVDMGGSLPSKIVNMMVGNKADYIQMAKDMKTIAAEKSKE